MTDQARPLPDDPETPSEDDASSPGSVFDVGRNCWRVERAERVGLIVDGADYFAALREALIAARRQVMLIGWDFDFEIEMLPGESDEDGLAPDGYPNELGDFIDAIAERRQDLNLYLLKWNGAVLAAPARLLPSLALRVFSHETIHFALDGHHPFGACHHQKIVVVDDELAFCGGIDVTEQRWDTSDHTPGDPRRVLHDGSPAAAWHDATTALTGPVAVALGELARSRWKRATSDEIVAPSSPPSGSHDAADVPWPREVTVAMTDAQVAIARTYPPFDDAPLVNEIEELYLDSVRMARNVIYIESQYFTTGTIIDAIEERLRETGGPEIVVVNPQSAFEALEDSAMHPLRGRMIQRLHDADREGRFRIFYPADAAGEPIYVHAKIFIADDRLLHLGSSNLDDRSMGFDTECDVALEGADEDTRAAIRSFHLRLLAEHLDATSDEVAAAWGEKRTIIEAIDMLNPPEGRGLRPIRHQEEGALDRFLADTRMLDPRYGRGEPSHAGRGLRPRHLVAGAALVGALVLAWGLWKRGSRGRP
ncbi:phosphatidylserine/phosphatidylglycerophosphate/cardiolipin synthase-like enzyme [Hasllibacter halocynthiae]|uniref:Phospholipase D n=1 Tax=Hasllibacter halocynthiae TaxID=595589 RepID=A0A2T0X9Z9_9RHOB|nr:phospholipase D-like domain-containing protein [Hasllibacter halocynthiae]PRY95755.1 phosphatidylserine/phosphatidylglycerophosphate/cardiolipin synthase-like enzyme [Hasllibacter halocynthiae]